MIKPYKLLLVLLSICTVLVSFCACGPSEEQDPPAVHKDYAAEVKLDMTSSTVKKEVTVKTFIDGDTTHFYFSGGDFEDDVFKARYLAINTPESTGKIEEWGKKASQFTREKLESATSIILESDNDKWNVDSTGNRYMVWIWYKTAEMTEYRNLNIEILQNGLAIASNSANNRYGTTCVAAIDQAKLEKLFIYSGQKDPDFHYGAATELTLKELRCNISEYDNVKVSFEGVIVKSDSGMAYVEEYDAENDMYCGIPVYYATAGLPGKALEILSTGNRVRIVGTVTNYHGNWQVSGLTLSLMKPDHEDNLKLISQGHTPAYSLITADTFKNGTVQAVVNDELKTYSYVDLAIGSSIEMKDLKVVSIYTTDSGDSKGAMTLTCKSADGIEISVRTVVLREANGNPVTAERFEGATIDVKGLVDLYTYNEASEYQIKVFSVDDVTIHP